MEITEQTPKKTFVRDILDKLPNADDLKEYAEYECETKKTLSEVEDLVSGERAAVHWASTKAVDEVGDVMVPSGCDLTTFNKTRTVFVDHGSMWEGYTLDKVLGSSMWIKNKNDQGLLAKTRFATTPVGEDGYTLVKEDIVKSWSIGFFGIKAARPDDRGWGDAVNLARAGGDMKGYTPKWMDQAQRIFTEWKLLEYSLVPIPANPGALTLAVSKNLGITKSALDMMGVDLTEAGEAIEELSKEEATEPLVREVRRFVPRHVQSVSRPMVDADIIRSVKRAVDIHRGRI